MSDWSCLQRICCNLHFLTPIQATSKTRRLRCRQCERTRCRRWDRHTSPRDLQIVRNNFIYIHSFHCFNTFPLNSRFTAFNYIILLSTIIINVDVNWWIGWNVWIKLLLAHDIRGMMCQKKYKKNKQSRGYCRPPGEYWCISSGTVQFRTAGTVQCELSNPNILW